MSIFQKDILSSTLADCFKSKIKNSQIKAALQVNSELISLYWDSGGMICEKHKKAGWGSEFIVQMAKKLKT